MDICCSILELSVYLLGRDLSQRGIACQVLNLKSSHFRKLSIVGKFVHTHTLNLDFSTSLSGFREDCFSSMPYLRLLSLCETRITNLWTTSAALSKLPSLDELRFQNCSHSNDAGCPSASSVNEGIVSGRTDLGLYIELPSPSDDVLPNLQLNADDEDLDDYDMDTRSTNADSSDDSEVDFSGHHLDFVSTELYPDIPFSWSELADLENEISLDTHDEDSFLGAHSTRKREIRANPSSIPASRKNCSSSSTKSQYFYSRSLSVPKMGSWPTLHPLSIMGGFSRDERQSFRPRQFEYHPTDSRLMIFGTLDGEVVVINHESEKIVSYVPSLGAMNSVLGLCWLKRYPSKLIAGSDNGSLRLYEIQYMPTTSGGMSQSRGNVIFDEFDQLTSVHVNSTDELFLASGYSKNLAMSGNFSMSVLAAYIRPSSNSEIVEVNLLESGDDDNSNSYKQQSHSVSGMGGLYAVKSFTVILVEDMNVVHEPHHIADTICVH
ncbi:hypothetical protein SASPL_121212 [Salvia splendens]|uniref:DWD hypersensitive to UV-B 1 N-terminal domain-containing protein n=1 Tax=Salvia splendens TaxID=180675 RepID=A0A8X8XUG3_SALSN|nr:hypothetical protein SASPL_121212 [Salvia splendens]